MTAIRRTPQGDYYWVILNDNNQILVTSVFSYPTKEEVIESVAQDIESVDELVDQTEAARYTCR